MRARYYTPNIKRLINQDILTGSIGESPSPNRYSYVQGNPVSYLAPFGLAKGLSDSLPKAEIDKRLKDTFVYFMTDNSGKISFGNETSYGKSSVKNKNTADFLSDIQYRNGKYYADKTTIDGIGQIEASGEDFSLLKTKVMSSRPSTEGGSSIVYRYSDDLGTKYLIHEVTDANGFIIHRDFDAVRILSGQLINKGY